MFARITNSIGVPVKDSSGGVREIQPTSDSIGRLRTIAANVRTLMREAFDVYTPGASDARWAEAKAPGDIVQVDGNALGSSYLVISKDPLSAGTETSIESLARFVMPFEVSVGLHISQRTSGQEFSVEVVDEDTPLADVPELTISTMSQASTTLTITTTAPHGFSVGKCFGIYGCASSAMNYSQLVVASVLSPTQFTATSGPNGGIPNLTVGPFTSGFIYYRERFGRANDGLSMILENTTSTQASVYARCKTGDALPSGTVAGNHSITVGNTLSTVPFSGAYTYGFQPTTEFRFSMHPERVGLIDMGVDATASPNHRIARTQIVPSSDKQFKLRVRATNTKGMTKPVAKIISATKAGSNVATIVTDAPHGLTGNDNVVVYGVRDQTNFVNASGQVASVVNATTFTLAFGASFTGASYGGTVYIQQGAVGGSAVGAASQVIQSISRSNNVLNLTGSAAWTGISVGDYVNVHGCRDDLTGSDAGVDGAYRVQNVSGTALILEPVSASSPTGGAIGTKNCGGTVIKRTDVRLSFVRVFDAERERVELQARGAGDNFNVAPFTVQGGSVNISGSPSVQGNAAIDAAFTQPVGQGFRAANSNPNAMSANADVVGALATMIGALVSKPYAIPEAEWVASLALTTTTATAIQAAAGAGLKRHTTSLWAINTGASAVDLIILDGATERLRYPLLVNVPTPIDLPTGMVVTANTALNANLSAASTVRLNALGYTAP